MDEQSAILEQIDDTLDGIVSGMNTMQHYGYRLTPLPHHAGFSVRDVNGRWLAKVERSQTTGEWELVK